MTKAEPISSEEIAASLEDLKQMWSAMVDICMSIPGAGQVLASRSQLPPFIDEVFEQAKAMPREVARSEKPVAWRYRYEGPGVEMEWRYVDREEECNPLPSYKCEPLYAVSPQRESSRSE